MYPVPCQSVNPTNATITAMALKTPELLHIVDPAPLLCVDLGAEDEAEDGVVAAATVVVDILPELKTGAEVAPAVRIAPGVEIAPDALVTPLICA